MLLVNEEHTRMSGVDTGSSPSFGGHCRAITVGPSHLI